MRRQTLQIIGPCRVSKMREGTLIAAADKALQQLGLARRAAGLQGRQPANVAHKRVPGRHAVGSVKSRLSFSFILGGDEETLPLF